MNLRRRLLAARRAYRAFLLPTPDTDCPVGVCSGSGVLSIVDMDRSYEQDCVCLPLLPRTPRRVERRLRGAVLAEVVKRARS
jgi:hypothetical protein